jgi:hypothetical protein
VRERAESCSAVVPLEEILGTADRGREFDCGFRSTSASVRSQWEPIAAATRRGRASSRPVRIGEICFVRDGHHHVSVGRALGRTEIDALSSAGVWQSAPEVSCSPAPRSDRRWPLARRAPPSRR